MKRFVKVSLATTFSVLLLSICAYAQAEGPKGDAVKPDVSGKWTGTFDVNGPDGDIQHQTAVLMLKQEGGTVTGTAGPTSEKQFKIKDGKVEGQEILLQVEIDGGMIMTLQLHLQNEKLSGAAACEIPGGKLTAKIDVTREK